MTLTLIYVFFIHWVADFGLQTRYQGNNKSHNIKALLSHTITYSACWLVLLPVLGFNAIYFVAITFVCHTITDFFTSKLTAFLWIRREYYAEIFDKKTDFYEHAFWAAIGGDQFLHAAQLILTYYLLK